MKEKVNLIRRGNRMLKCGDHPGYTAYFKPRKSCVTCWILWFTIHGYIVKRIGY